MIYSKALDPFLVFGSVRAGLPFKPGPVEFHPGRPYILFVLIHKLVFMDESNQHSAKDTKTRSCLIASAER